MDNQKKKKKKKEKRTAPSGFEAKIVLAKRREQRKERLPSSKKPKTSNTDSMSSENLSANLPPETKISLPYIFLFHAQDCT